MKPGRPEPPAPANAPSPGDEGPAPGSTEGARGGFEGRLAGLAFQAMRRNLAAAFADRENAAALYRELLARPRESRLEAVESEEAFASPGLGHALLDRAEALLAENPREAGHLASLAAQIGSRLPAPWTLLERESLQGRGRSLEGEALRRQGAVAPARIAQRRAFRHFEVLPVGCVERADFCRYLSRLRRDQGRDDEALALMARALERFESSAEPRRARECRLELAWMHLDDLEPDAALELLEAALLEEGDDLAGTVGERSGRWLSLRHGLALAYADLRRENAARTMLAEIAAGASDRGSLHPLRVKLVEASILRRLDAEEEAAEILFQVWTGHAVDGAHHDAALALLELAQLRAEQASERAVAELARLLEGLEGLCLPETVRGPLRFGLSFAREHGLAAIEMLEALKLFVERARHNPLARFSLTVDP